MKPLHLDNSSAEGSQMNLGALYKIAPSCFTEVRDERTGELRHKVDFEALRSLLGDNAVEGAEEMYQFTWPGKREAKREAARQIDKTLRPVKEDSVDWDTTENLYIEGDNLDALKLLQRSYLGKVKMIYIDPPYNTGNDFIYNDDFSQSAADYDAAAGNVDELGRRYRRNTDSNGRFHSDWCSMIYSRLLMARTLLTEDGVIFISIDDNEVENLRKICDEVFGEGNFVAQFIWEKRLNRENRKAVSVRHDYILCFCKSISSCKIAQLPMDAKALANYGNPDNDPRGLWKSDPAHTQGGHGTKSQFYTLIAPNGKRHELPSGRCWIYTEAVMQEAIKDNRIWFGKDGNGVPRVKTYLNSKDRGLTPETILFAKDVSTNEGAKNSLKNLFDGVAVFETPKPETLIKHLISIVASDNDIVLDFFSGSAATSHAVMQLNAEDGGKRKFILVQLPEETAEDSEARKAGYKNICEIGKERIRRAGKKIKADSPLITQDLDTGFRVLRIDESNYENVKLAPQEYDQLQLDFFADNIRADRTDMDLLFGCLTSWGLPLSLPMESETVDGCTVFTVNDGDLVAVFSENVTEEVVRFIAQKHPLRIVFRDKCFSEDKQKINLFEQFKQLLDWSEEDAMKNIRVI